MIENSLSPDLVFKISADIVVREIEEEIIIVPLTAGIGDLDDGLYTLNETARACWNKIDGSVSLADIAGQLCEEFDSPAEKIQQDVLGLAAELARLKIIIPVAPTENR